MLITVLRSKIHTATVTQTDLHYEGSISIDVELLEKAGMLPHEQVDVLNINTGQRFTTYTIEAERGSKIIGINGAAARLAEVGDKCIIIAYCHLDIEEARTHQPKILLVGDDNNVVGE